jgi:hypothetical protein
MCMVVRGKNPHYSYVLYDDKPPLVARLNLGSPAGGLSNERHENTKYHEDGNLTRDYTQRVPHLGRYLVLLRLIQASALPDKMCPGKILNQDRSCHSTRLQNKCL